MTGELTVAGVVSLLVFAALSWAVIGHLGRLSRAVASDGALPGRRTRRRLMRRGGWLIGWWQLATAACLVTVGGSWANAVPLLMMGAGFVAASMVAKRHPGLGRPV